MWVDSTLQLLKIIVTVLTFVLQKKVSVFSLTGEEYVWSAVASAMFLASSLFHDDVTAHRCGLSILPECREGAEVRYPCSSPIEPCQIHF